MYKIVSERECVRAKEHFSYEHLSRCVIKFFCLCECICMCVNQYVFTSAVSLNGCAFVCMMCLHVSVYVQVYVIELLFVQIRIFAHIFMQN